MRFFDTFSGIGGFTIPLLKSGWECAGYCEIDKYANVIYKRHFPDHENYGDIAKITASALPDFDLLVGGFPCQSFSIAGKRGGFEDTRGTLFFCLADIARVKRPRYLLFENVKGLLSHDKGNTFATIISTIDELGYDLQWQVLNSKNFGVPQNRERVFIVGHLRGKSRPKIFPLGKNDKEFNGTASKSLTAKHHGVATSGTCIKQVNKPKHSNDRVYDANGISPALNTMQGGNRQPFIVASRGRYNKDGGIEQRLEFREDGITNSLTSVEKDNMIATAPLARKYNSPHRVNRIRRLTPTECERLQGFPDGWTEGVSDTQRYKCLGNAVTVNVVSAIVSKF